MESKDADRCLEDEKMHDRRAEGRWLLIGILISGGAGILLGFITKKPYIVIAAGIISAYIVQRLRETSEKKTETSHSNRS